MSDNVNHPNHYTQNSNGIQVIEITRNLGFNQGNAVKYISRAEYKGKKLEDLQKAEWYLNDDLHTLETSKEELILDSTRLLTDLEVQFLRGTELNPRLKNVIAFILMSYTSPTVRDIQCVQNAIDYLSDELDNIE